MARFQKIAIILVILVGVIAVYLWRSDLEYNRCVSEQQFKASQWEPRETSGFYANRPQKNPYLSTSHCQKYLFSELFK